jgi:hypothetical protein
MFNIGIARDSHLVVVCTGAPRHNDFLALIDFAASIVRMEGWRGLLVDVTAVPPVLTADERADIGAYAGRTLAGCRVALVVASQDRFVVPLSAAAQDGGSVRGFVDHRDAIAWLSATAAPPTASAP